MNSFIQEYGRTIVTVIIVLAFVVFASVYGNTVTTGIKDMANDFFAKSGVTDEYSFSWSNPYGGGNITKGQNLLSYNDGETDISKYYYDWDYDGNWYKLSNNTYLDKTLYCKWKVKDEPRLLTGFAGQEFKGVMYQSTNNRGTAWIIPGLEMGLIQSVPEEYTYASGSHTVTLTPGLYVYDLVGAAFEESESLEVYVCEVESADLEDVETVTYGGEEYVKISSKTFTEEDVIGKTLKYTIDIAGDSVEQSVSITEGMVYSDNGIISCLLLYSVEGDGVYIPKYTLTGEEGGVIDTITIR